MLPVLRTTSELIQVATDFGTPLYVYDCDRIQRQYHQLQRFLPNNFRIHYALKANSNLSICHQLARLGAASEVSSWGEMAAALTSGFAAAEMVFTGPGKSRQALAHALDHGIGLVVLESLNEAQRLGQLAAERGRVQSVLLRVNPDYRSSHSCGASACDTLKPIQMNGQGASKFGVDEAQLTAAIAALTQFPSLRLEGIHVFTESNVLNYAELLTAWRHTISIGDRLRRQGLPVHTLDFGGGIGIAYDGTNGEFATEAFGAALAQLAEAHSRYRCILEIGRYLVGEAGYYLCEVLDVKLSQGQRFVIVDGGIHHLYRTPAMQAASKYLRVLGKESTDTQPAVLAGQLPTPVDVMVRGVELPVDIAVGDIIAIQNCGAYGFNHSLTNFSLHPYPAEVAIAQGQPQLIRTRGTVEDFFHRQPIIHL